MPTKKKPGKRRSVPRVATLAEDERLREELRNADLRKFEKALAKAIRSPTR